MSWSKGASPWGGRSPPSVFLTANSQRSCPAGAKVLIGGRRLCQLARPNFGRVILDGKGAWERVLVIRDPEGREVRGSVDPRMPGRGRPADKARRVSEAVVGRGILDAELGDQETSLWEEARRSCRKASPYGRHGFAGAKCRSKAVVGPTASAGQRRSAPKATTDRIRRIPCRSIPRS
jgi:hypothetical protein